MQIDSQNMVEGDLDRLVYNEFFSHRSTGIIVDVGAGRPDFLSISRFYRDVGWRVVAIEPNPMFCARYRAAGFDILEYACGNHDADDVPFTVVTTDRRLPRRPGIQQVVLVVGST